MMAVGLISNSLLLLRLSLGFWLLTETKGQMIVKEPLSLLIPANHIGVYTCKARCDGCRLTGFWTINEIHSRLVEGLNSTRTQNDNEYTLTLRVNASEAMNNTRIQCRYQASGNNDGQYHSATVYLYVISSPPISSNPSLVKNATHLTLMWSPPFLWPGRRIQSYNISVTNKSDGSITLHRVNSSLKNPLYNSLMVFSMSLSNTPLPSMFSCTGIIFSISAIDQLTSEQMQTFHISDWSWTFPTITASDSEFTTSAINASVLFKADGTPALVEANIQLPRSNCSYGELNYTLLLKNDRGDLVARVGPFPFLDSGVVMERIISDIKENRNYSLQLRVEAQSQTATSQRHFFSTHYSSCYTSSNASKAAGNDSSIPYMALIAIFVALILLLLISLLVVTVCYYVRHRKRILDQETAYHEPVAKSTLNGGGGTINLAISDLKGCRITYSEKLHMKFNASKNRVCDVMVHNPIYDGDGPVYESVQTRVGTTNAAESGTNIQPHSADMTDRHYDNLRQSLSDTARYVDPPGQLQYLYTNTASDVNSSANTAVVRSMSVSIPLTTRVMALKKNGQEHNKLHLTLPLGGNDSSNECGGEATLKSIPKSIPKSLTDVSHQAESDVDEAYAVMSPAGVLCRSLNSGQVMPVSST